MGHCHIPDAEAILDQEFPVLNKGFVRLVDYLGGDRRIVQAARVSYGSGTKTYREDKALIDYLLRNEHTSPFEQVVFTFHVKLPIFVARQWIRHRTARVNEISGRYSILKDDFYVPQEDDVAFQSSSNKQGRSAELVPSDIIEEVVDCVRDGQRRAYSDYQELLNKNIARELARINLPLSLYTEWYWQIDLHNLFHFLKLRLDEHAQKEIREYAQTVYAIATKVCPIACAVFEEHILSEIKFSRSELVALRNLLEGNPKGLTESEAKRFDNKLKRIWNY